MHSLFLKIIWDCSKVFLFMHAHFKWNLTNHTQITSRVGNSCRNACNSWSNRATDNNSEQSSLLVTATTHSATHLLTPEKCRDSALFLQSLEQRSNAPQWLKVLLSTNTALLARPPHSLQSTSISCHFAFYKVTVFSHSLSDHQLNCFQCRENCREFNHRILKSDYLQDRFVESVNDPHLAWLRTSCLPLCYHVNQTQTKEQKRYQQYWFYANGCISL